MRLTTKGRFAVTAMIDLGLRSHSGPVTLSAISARQNISLSYLEQLFSKLRRHELVESVRGPGGGYMLARNPREITVADIVFAVDEPLDATGCGNKVPCTTGRDGRDHGTCMTHDLWSSLNAHMVDYLDSVSLQDLVDHQRLGPSEKSKLEERNIQFRSKFDSNRNLDTPLIFKGFGG